MRDYIEYTADHEEPMCHRCDNADMPDKWCMKNCGGANWWAGYRRTERIEVCDNEINRFR